MEDDAPAVTFNESTVGNEASPVQRTSGRVTRKPNIIISTMTGKSHGNSCDQGVNFPLVGKYHPDNDRDSIDYQYAVAVYKTRQAVVHFNVGDSASPLKTMTEEQSDAHIVGVIFAKHINLKKGLELIGEKEDAAVHNSSVS